MRKIIRKIPNKSIIAPVIFVATLVFFHSFILASACTIIYLLYNRRRKNHNEKEKKAGIALYFLKGDSKSYLCRRKVVTELYFYPKKNIIILLKPLKVEAYLPLKVSKEDSLKIMNTFKKLDIDAICIHEGREAVLVLKYTTRAFRLSNEVLQEIVGGLAARLSVVSEYAGSFRLADFPQELSFVLR